jgi:hypothetical protein
MADLFKPSKSKREQYEEEARELIREQRARERERATDDRQSSSTSLWFKVKRLLMMKL